jgi:hypothetical protein
MRSLSGSVVFPFSEMVRDTIREHGLSWAVSYYRGKHGLSAREFRIFSGI